MSNAALATFGDKAVTSAQLARTLAEKLTTKADPGEVVMARSQAAELVAFVREFKVAVDEATLDWLDANGDLDIGDGRRLYAGKVKKTKRKREPGEIFEALMKASFGDLDTIKRCLSANWCKYAELREVGQDLFDECFEVEEVIEPKTGAAKRAPTMTR